MKLFYACLALFIITSCKQNIQSDPKKVISSYMEEQELSWNERDLNGFMKHYWKSDSLSFIGKSGLNKGWQTTLDNYMKSYNNKDEMGVLKFINITIEQIDKNTIHVIGHWKLTRKEEIGDLEGYYSLIWQQKNNKWVIIADHSS